MSPHVSSVITAPPLPVSELDPAWTIVEEGFNPLREREIESIMTVGNGFLGTRGSVEEGTSVSEPATFLAGVYDTEPDRENQAVIAVAPEWQWLTISVGDELLSLETGTILEHRRVLDLRTGMVSRLWRQQDLQGRITQVRTVRLASLAKPYLTGQHVAVMAENHSEPITVSFGLNARTRAFPIPGRKAWHPNILKQQRISEGGILLSVQLLNADIQIAYASQSHPVGETVPSTGPQHMLSEGQIAEVWTVHPQPGQWLQFHRLVGIAHGVETSPIPTPAEAPGEYPTVTEQVDQKARTRLFEAIQAGFDSLQRESLQAWASRWRHTDIVLDGDVATQQALRFAMYHLTIAATPWNERVSIGARSLSGYVYEGHVFWDTEIFILPYFSYTWPEAARSMLMYRYNTLKGARRNARESGYQGAYFAWESAISGEEETIPYMRLPDGEIVPILSGTMEDHIVADVAFGVWQYWHITGDDVFMRDYGVELMIDCARFWGSRVEGPDETGRYHIRKVIGPDEYHEKVDNNAFTNVMASWNLDRAGLMLNWLRTHYPESVDSLCHRLEAEPEELEVDQAYWQHVSKNLEINYHSSELLFEQHEGFFDLEPVSISKYIEAVAPIDVVLGRDYIQRSQVIKQADVLMIFLLLGHLYAPYQWATNFYYYEPRTAHGSSLSPGIHAVIAARVGDLPMALRYFNETASIDLSNNMGNASGGVHIASMGALWQAVTTGFGGIRTNYQLENPTLHIDPMLPHTWKRLSFRLKYRGQWIRLTLGNEPEHDDILLEHLGDQPIQVQLGVTPMNRIEPGARVRWKRTESSGVWQLDPTTSPKEPPLQEQPECPPRVTATQEGGADARTQNS